MEYKDSFDVSGIRNSVEVLQNEQSKLEFYLQDLIRIRKRMEEKSDDASYQISKLNEDIHRLKATNKINEYKAEMLEKEANELENASKILTDEIGNSRNQLKQRNEKFQVEVEQMEKESEHLCQLFVKASSLTCTESLEKENSKMLLEIEELKKEYNKIQGDIVKAKSDLDEVLLYEAPLSEKEKELPLGQRKIVMNIMEEARKNAENQLQASRHMLAEKQAELQKLG